MSLLVPRSTTGAAVAVQASENVAVQNTDEAWANLTVPVVTIAGQQDLSRQSLERGAPGLDQLVMTDLSLAYYAEQERQCLQGTGAAGQMIGVLATAGVGQATAFAAAVTAATFYTKVAGMVSAVTTGRFLAPDAIAMHPRRWAWLLAQLDTSNRPLAVPTASSPMNAIAVGDPGYNESASVGKFMGLDVFLSAQLPIAAGTGPEDQVVVVYRCADLLLWQRGDGAPEGLRFEQPLGNQLTVKLVAYGYSAFTAGRYPAAVGLIGGNAAAGFGLVAPAF